MIEYALNETPRHGLARSVLSHDHTCPGPVAYNTGAARGTGSWRRLGSTSRADWSAMPAATRQQERREESITPSSQADANECQARSRSFSREGCAHSFCGIGSVARGRGFRR